MELIMEVKTLKGVTLASIAGICWGSMGVAAQYLMANCQFTVLDLTSIRLLGAGILLVLLDIFWNRTHHVKAVFQKENLKDILVYGFALLCSQSTFFMSISSSNAATATIMVLTSPLFIIAYLAVAHHRRIKVLEMICLVLAMIGVILIITKGNWDTMDFSVAGVAWGLLSAMLGAVGTIQPGARCQKTLRFSGDRLGNDLQRRSGLPVQQSARDQCDLEHDGHHLLPAHRALRHDCLLLLFS